MADCACTSALGSAASVATGVCNNCRIKAAWQWCSACSNLTIPPQGGSCQFCGGGVAPTVPATVQASTSTPTTTSPPYTGACRGGCGTTLGAHAVIISTGLCKNCRRQQGWKICSSCGNYAISPNGDPCPVCHPNGVPVSSVAASSTTSTQRMVKCKRWQGTYFTAGKTYPVVGEEATRWCLTNEFGNNIWVGKPDFQLVSGSSPTSTSAHVSAPTPTVDITDWKVWRDHGRAPNECACGMLRTMCDYHRD